MPTKKLKTTKFFLRPVHFQAILLLVVYYFVSNIVFVGSVTHPNVYVSFLVPFLFGLVSTFAFLYFFSHKDFFHFMSNVEKEQKGKEKKILGKVGHYGNIAACAIVSAVGGPILLSLTIRFLFSEKENRYLIAFISVLISTILTVAAARGLFNFIF